MEKMKRESFAAVNLYVDVERGNGYTIPTKFRANCWGLKGESNVSLLDAIKELDRKFIQELRNYENFLGILGKK